MKVGGKPTIKDKAKAVETRLGATTGASKGYKPPPKPKVKAYPKKDGFKAKVTIKW